MQPRTLMPLTRLFRAGLAQPEQVPGTSGRVGGGRLDVGRFGMQARVLWNL